MSDLQFVTDAIRCCRQDLAEILCSLADDLDHGEELQPLKRLRARQLVERYDRLNRIKDAIITGKSTWYQETATQPSDAGDKSPL